MTELNQLALCACGTNAEAPTAPVVEAWMTLNGLDTARRLDTFSWDAKTGMPEPLVTESIVSGVSFGKAIPIADFAPLEGASASGEIELQPRQALLVKTLNAL